MASPQVEELSRAVAALTKNVDNALPHLHSAYVLSNTSILDGLLSQLLKKHLPGMAAKTLENKLFSTYRPLSTLSAKIDMCFAMSLIDRQHYELLDKIRGIRNDFAHPPGVSVTLATPSVAAKIANLPQSGADNLSRFIAAVEDCKLHLINATQRKS